MPRAEYEDEPEERPRLDRYWGLEDPEEPELR